MFAKSLYPAARRSLWRAASPRLVSTRTEPFETWSRPAAAALLAATTVVVVASCEAAEDYQPVPNPVWPAGIREKDIEALVTDCLSDPTINISTIPDYLEKQIYRSTIKLTLNALYETLGELHGTEFFGHELRVSRTSDQAAGIAGANREYRLGQMRDSVAEDVLDKVVEGLLANKAVNQPLIPDVVERQLYRNCLVIIFRVLDMMAATLNLTCCGHDLGFTVEPSQSPVFTGAAVDQATRVDPALVLEYARQMGLRPDREVDQDRSWWDKFFRPAQDEFLAQLHATLYALVVGILDDVLANTKISLLSDTLQFDLVPIPLEVQQARRLAKEAGTTPLDEMEVPEAVPESSVALPLATFTAGLGVGLTLMSLLKKKA